MDIRIELLNAAREVEVERAAQRRRLDAVLATCRSRIFGIFPVARPCDASVASS